MTNGQIWEAQRYVCWSELFIVSGILYLAFIFNIILNKWWTSQTQDSSVLPLSLFLALFLFAVTFLHSGTQFNLEGKKPKPNLLTMMLNGLFFPLPGLREQLWGSERWSVRTGTFLEYGQHVFTFMESWMNLAIINPNWVSWCFPSKCDHFVKSKSMFSPGKGPCARGGGVNGQEPPALSEATWCNSPASFVLENFK